MMKRNPDVFREMSQSEFDKAYNVAMRDETGNTPVEAPRAGSYAEQRLKELKEQRAKYNVNDLGYYKGGLPVKGRGTVRGSAIGRPGDFHSPAAHNYLNNYHADSKVVDSEDTVKFKAWMQSDKVDYTMTRPSHPMFYDRDFSFMKDRVFFMRLILAFLFGVYGFGRMYVERDRMMRWDRIENLSEMPAHHFHNRGGVLIKKQFAGFEKIHKNGEDVAAWYRKAYPEVFAEQAQ